MQVEAIKALENILSQPEIKDAVVAAGFLPVMIDQLSNCRLAEILRKMADALVSLVDVTEYAIMAIDLGIMTALKNAMCNTTSIESHSSIVNAISSSCSMV